MPRYYVDYGSDGGWAIQSSHDVIECKDMAEAKAMWTDKVTGKVVYDRLPPEALFEVPSMMHDWPKGKVLEHYSGVEFGRHGKSCQYVAPEDEKIIQIVTQRVDSWWQKFLNLLSTKY